MYKGMDRMKLNAQQTSVCDLKWQKQSLGCELGFQSFGAHVSVNRAFNVTDHSYIIVLFYCKNDLQSY
jgi:hypothetical protein